VVIKQEAVIIAVQMALRSDQAGKNPSIDK
jgi:hypothetical protein